MPEVTWFPDVGFDQTRLQASSKNWGKNCNQFRKSEHKTRKIFPYIFLRFPFKNLQILEEACAKKKYVFVQKPGQKNRALVPSDEGRVRWSSSVRTMFATGNVFEDRNDALEESLHSSVTLGFFFVSQGLIGHLVHTCSSCT